MGASRQRVKGRATSKTYLGLPHALLRHPNYARLSAYAVKLIVDLGMQYNGFNNGDLCMAWSVMQPLGWRSKTTLYKAKDELLEIEFIELTRQGGKHVCSLYALTWQSIDECKGKLEVLPTKVASGAWNKTSD